MATKKKTTRKAERATAGKLVVSEKASPAVTLKPGMRFDVRRVDIVNPDLKKVGKVAARLCGGTSTCLALIDLDKESNFP